MTVSRIAKRLGLKHSGEYLNRDNTIGQKFGHLMVVDEGKIKGCKGITCTCQCDCGNICYVRKAYLIEGRRKSCGCNIHFIKHGCSKDKLYHLYYMMRARCNNPHNKDYKHYGMRGIRVCSEWMFNYESFRKWSYRNGYQEGLTIDRIDNDGNYCPENCRWVPMSTQNLNKRTSRKITYRGKTQTLFEWARELNVNYHTLYGKVSRGTFPPKDNQQTDSDKEHQF